MSEMDRRGFMKLAGLGGGVVFASSLGLNSLGSSGVNGDKELAIKNYQRAVELNPQNTNAIEMLKKLRTQ